MVGIISRYKSDIVEYAKKEDIVKEDFVAACTQADVDRLKDAVDEVVVLEKPWRGFDLEAVTLYMCKQKKDEPKKDVKKAPVKNVTPKVIAKPAKITPKTAPGKVSGIKNKE